jgi:hypothetical protein
MTKEQGIELYKSIVAVQEEFRIAMEKMDACIASLGALEEEISEAVGLTQEEKAQILISDLTAEEAEQVTRMVERDRKK